MHYRNCDTTGKVNKTIILDRSLATEYKDDWKNWIKLFKGLLTKSGYFSKIKNNWKLYTKKQLYQA